MNQKIVPTNPIQDYPAEGYLASHRQIIYTPFKDMQTSACLLLSPDEEPLLNGQLALVAAVVKEILQKRATGHWSPCLTMSNPRLRTCSCWEPFLDVLLRYAAHLRLQCLLRANGFDLLSTDWLTNALREYKIPQVLGTEGHAFFPWAPDCSVYIAHRIHMWTFCKRASHALTGPDCAKKAIMPDSDFAKALWPGLNMVEPSPTQASEFDRLLQELRASDPS